MSSAAVGGESSRTHAGVIVNPENPRPQRNAACAVPATARRSGLEIRQNFAEMFRNTRPPHAARKKKCISTFGYRAERGLRREHREVIREDRHLRESSKIHARSCSLLLRWNEGEPRSPTW